MKKLMSKLYVVIISLTFLIFIYSLSQAIYQKYEDKNNIKEQIKIKEIYVSIEKSEINPILEYRKLYNNEEIVGTLKIEGTKIDEVVLQTTNNSYYLNHLPNKKSNYLGSLFVDYQVDLNTSNKIIIYGHNSRTKKTTFKNLENYLDKEFYLTNNLIKFSTLNEEAIYEVFSVMITSDDSLYRKLDFKTSEEILKNYEYLKNESIYESNIELKESDKILILQTCLYNNAKGNLLVIVARKTI